MDSSGMTFTAWSFGFVGVAHLAFALHLIGGGYGRSMEDPERRCHFLVP